jgi:hypothetical protein
MLIFCSSKSSNISVVKNGWPVPTPKYHHPPLYQVLDCTSPDAGLCYLSHPKGCLQHTHWNFHSPLRPAKIWPSWTVAIILPNTQFIYTLTTHELISNTISNRDCSFHKFLMTKSCCSFSNISSNPASVTRSYATFHCYSDLGDRFNRYQMRIQYGLLMPDIVVPWLIWPHINYSCSGNQLYNPHYPTSTILLWFPIQFHWMRKTIVGASWTNKHQGFHVV